MEYQSEFVPSFGQLRKIAASQRLILRVFLASILVNVVALKAPVLGLLGLGLLVYMIYLIATITEQMKMGNERWLLVLAQIVPLISLIALGYVVIRANGYFAKNGIPTRFLGPTDEDLDQAESRSNHAGFQSAKDVGSDPD